MHRNPDLWHRPNEFLPERWLEPKLQALDEGQSNGAFMPFAFGPRNCVGQGMAKVVLRIVLARLLQRYSFAPNENMPIPNLKNRNVGFTTFPAAPELKIRERQRS